MEVEAATRTSKEEEGRIKVEEKKGGEGDKKEERAADTQGEEEEQRRQPRAPRGIEEKEKEAEKTLEEKRDR